jgi:hypothetical protein
MVSCRLGGVVQHACRRWGKRPLARGRCDHLRAIPGSGRGRRNYDRRGMKHNGDVGTGRNRRLDVFPQNVCPAGEECADVFELREQHDYGIRASRIL